VWESCPRAPAHLSHYTSFTSSRAQLLEAAKAGTVGSGGGGGGSGDGSGGGGGGRGGRGRRKGKGKGKGGKGGDDDDSSDDDRPGRSGECDFVLLCPRRASQPPSCGVCECAGKLGEDDGSGSDSDSDDGNDAFAGGARGAAGAGGASGASAGSKLFAGEASAKDADEEEEEEEAAPEEEVSWARARVCRRNERAQACTG